MDAAACGLDINLLDAGTIRLRAVASHLRLNGDHKGFGDYATLYHPLDVI